MSAQLFEPLEAGRQPILRLSVDPSLFARSYFQEADMSGFDVAVDTEVKQNLYLETSFGVANISQTTDAFSYVSDGVYATLGANLNLTAYQNPQDRHIFYFGVHYGFARLNHHANDIVISDYYWGDARLSVPQEVRSASWVELTLGIKAEAAKNFFIGWSAESKLRTHLSPGEMSPYYIPGFGKAENALGLGFNIWVSYAISFKPRKYESLLEISE